MIVKFTIGKWYLMHENARHQDASTEGALYRASTPIKCIKTTDYPCDAQFSGEDSTNCYKYVLDSIDEYDLSCEVEIL